MQNSEPVKKNQWISDHIIIVHTLTLIYSMVQICDSYQVAGVACVSVVDMDDHQVLVQVDMVDILVEELHVLVADVDHIVLEVVSDHTMALRQTVCKAYINYLLNE